jgi:cell division protein FtsB
MYNNNIEMGSPNFDFNSNSDYVFTSTDLKEDRVINKEHIDPFRYEKNIKYDDYSKHNLSTGGDERQRTPKAGVYLNYNYENMYSNEKAAATNNYSNNANYRRRINITDDEIFENPSDKKGGSRLPQFKRAEETVKARDTTANNDISSELSYYKNIIDTMQSDIMKLNYKLNDLEVKNNNTSHISNHHATTQSKTSERTVGGGSERLNQLEMEKELLSFRRIPDTQSKTVKIENTRDLSKGTRNKSNTKLNSAKTVSTRSASSDKKINKETNKGRSKTPSRASIKQTRSKTKSLTIDINKNTIDSSNHREQEQLKATVKHLEEKVKYLTQQLHFEKIEKKGKDHLRVELEIWKNRADSLSQNYLETLNGLRNQLAADKSKFTEEIKSAQKSFVTQVMALKDQYQSVIEKNETTIKKIRKENEDLRRKVHKVKDIIS